MAANEFVSSVDALHVDEDRDRFPRATDSCGVLDDKISLSGLRR